MRTLPPSTAHNGTNRCACLALGAVLILSTPASAQRDTLPRGARLRLDIVTMPPEVHLVGTLLGIHRDSLLLRVDANSGVGNDSVAVPLGLITDMAMSEGMGHAGAKGAGIGAFVAFLGVGGIGFATASGICSALDNRLYPEICEPQSKRFTRGLTFGLVGAAVGGGLGYLVGSAVPRERWRPLVVEGMRTAGAVLASGRATFGITLRL